MRKRLFSLLLILCLMATLPMGCRKAEIGPLEATAAPTLAPQATQAPAQPSTQAPQATQPPTQGPTAAPMEAETAARGYRFADHEEAADLLLAERRYYEGLSQNDLNYRLQKMDATLKELESYVRTQTRDYSEGEKAAIDKAMQYILASCEERGYRLPSLEDVVFAKTTMHEESDAGAYTHGTKIFLGEVLMPYAMSDDLNLQAYFRYILAHELFHCFTRNDPDFRGDMYAILGFTVVEEDFVFSREIREAIISNPDVGHHNSYAAFEIGGQLINCAVVFTAAPFQQPGDSFFSTMQTGLVPIDQLDVMYSSEDAVNFWDVFGRNTDYVIDPEETMADNFGFLLAYGTDMDYQTPELIKAMDAYLKAR